jgi:hypothetical protein
MSSSVPRSSASRLRLCRALVAAQAQPSRVGLDVEPALGQADDVIPLTIERELAAYLTATTSTEHEPLTFSL